MDNVSSAVRGSNFHVSNIFFLKKNQWPMLVAHLLMC